MANHGKGETNKVQPDELEKEGNALEQEDDGLTGGEEGSIIDTEDGKENENMIDEEPDDEDDRQSDKQLRQKLEKFLHNDEGSGFWIQIFIGVTSILSSIVFIFLCHFDWSDIDPCCFKIDTVHLNSCQTYPTLKATTTPTGNNYYNITKGNDTVSAAGVNIKQAGMVNKTCAAGYDAFCSDDGMPCYAAVYRTCHLPGTFTDPNVLWDTEPCRKFYKACAEGCGGQCVIKCDEFYYSRMPQIFEHVDLGLCLIYLVNYILNLFISQNRCQYFIEGHSIVDLVIIIPVIIYGYNCSKVGLLFKACSRVVRLQKLNLLVNLTAGEGEESNVVQKQKEIFQGVLIVFVFSSVMFMIIENFEITHSNYPYDFQTTFYIMIVTFVTVGYGDYMPESPLGRIFDTVMIIYTILYMLPNETANMVRLLGLKSSYQREKYTPNTEIPFIVITGQVMIQALVNFCEELFHEDHGLQDRHAVILQSNDPSHEMESFLNDPNREGRIKFLNGNPMIQQELDRAGVKDAKTCILLTNKNSKHAVDQDHKNILIGLAMKKYVYDKTGNPNMSLCMQLIKPESKQHFYSSLSGQYNDDQIIIVEEIKMNLMSKSCFSPGIINFISNLISTTGDQPELESRWLQEYASGMGHEIYRMKLSEKVENSTFAEIAGLVYKLDQSIVFAIEIKTNGKTIIRLNPSDFIVNNIKENQIYVYTICEDKKTADEIEVLGMSKEERLKYYNLKTQADKIAKEQKLEKDNSRIGMNEDQQMKQLNQSTSAMTYDDQGDQEEDQIQNDQGQRKLIHDYYVCEDPPKSMQITLASLENNPDVKNHIIVCGIHSAIQSFIKPLRARYLKKYQLQKIVIITGEPDERGGDQIDAQIANSIAKYLYVFLVNGSPLKQDTLLRANIHYADKVVILGHDSSLNTDVSDEMLDAESIYIYQAVRKINKSVQILTELVSNKNIEFLLPSYPPKGNYQLSTLYAAGEVYISAIIDTLTCQSYFNKHIVTILQQILKGESEEDDEQLRNMMKAHPDLTQSNLWQIPVPQECVTKTFDFLFNTLLKHKLICMALYRQRGATDNDYPYVYTNPDKETLITHRDKAFVLGVEIPDNLEGDKFEMIEKDKEVDLPGYRQEYQKNKMGASASQSEKKSMNKQQDGERSTNKNSLNNQMSINKSLQNDANTMRTSENGHNNRIEPTNDGEGDNVAETILGQPLKDTQKLSQVYKVAQKLEKSISQIEKAVNHIESTFETQNEFVIETTKKITEDYLMGYEEEFKDRIKQDNI